MSSHVRPPEPGFQIICESVVSSWGWLDTFISVLAIIIAAKYVVWQVRENARKNIHQRIYREISEANQNLMHAEADVANYVRTTSSNYLFLHQGILKKFYEARPSQLIDLMSALNSAHIGLIHLLETYEIASPKLTIFRTAYSVAFHDIQAAQKPLFDKYLYAMSVETPQGVFHKPDPNEEQVAAFEKASNDFIDKLMVVGGICYDLNVEAQNLLLGDVFDHRVPERKPLDPNVMVIRLKDAQKLQKYFEEETDWGREKRATEVRVRQENESKKAL